MSKDLDLDKPYHSRDGRMVKVIYTLDRDTGKDSYLVVATNDCGREYIYTVDKKGSYIPPHSHSWDVINKAKAPRYVALYRSDLTSRTNFASIDRLMASADDKNDKMLCVLEVETDDYNKVVDKVLSVPWRAHDGEKNEG